MLILCINTDNTINEIDLKKFNLKDCHKILTDLNDTRGCDNIEKIYSWAYENTIVEMYGWLLGESLIKNNHKLPPFGQSNIIDENSEDMILYGNIYILCREANNYIDYHIYDYGNFHYIFNELNINSNDINDKDDTIDTNDINDTNDDIDVDDVDDVDDTDTNDTNDINDIIDTNNLICDKSKLSNILDLDTNNYT